MYIGTTSLALLLKKLSTKKNTGHSQSMPRFRQFVIQRSKLMMVSLTHLLDIDPCYKPIDTIQFINTSILNVFWKQLMVILYQGSILIVVDKVMEV